MRYHLLGIGVLALAILSLSGEPAFGQKKDKNDTPPVDAGNLPPGVFQGKLLNLPTGTDRTFSLEVETKIVELDENAVRKLQQGNPNGQYARALEQLQRDQQRMARLQQELARARNPQEANRHVVEIQRLAQSMQQHQLNALKQAGNQVNVLKEKTVKRTLEIQADDEVKVRTLNLPIEFDGEGKLKKYTDAELKEKKGKDSKLPGYEAKLADLKVNSVVQVTLAKNPDLAPGKSDKDKKDVDMTEKKMQATVIVIIQEGEEPKGKDKKKK